MFTQENMLKEIFERQKALQNHIYSKHDMRDRDGNVLTIERVMAEAQDGLFGANHEPMKALLQMTRAISDEVMEIEDCLVWKHWSKAKLGEKEYPDQNQAERATQVAIEVVDILHFVVNTWLALGLDYEQLAAVYEEKRRINEERAKGNYNTARKTNADNDSLASRLAPILYPESSNWDD